MNFDKLFHKYKTRLLGEVFIKSILFSFTISAASVFLVSLIYHFLMTDAPNRILGAVCLITFLIGFVISFLRRYPTRKKVAARIDETGLQERISTMLEYSHKENDILRLQRNDALIHLDRTSPSRLRFRPSGMEFLLCLFCVLLAVVITRIPYDIWKVDVVETEINQEQLQIIEDLISQLREEVDDAIISKELKDQLNSIIQHLEDDLKQSNSELERVAQIENARQQIMEALQNAMTLYQIGEALQQFDLTRALGEAISLCDGNAVSSALLELEVLLTADYQLIPTLSGNINDALIASGVSSEDKLFQALNEFAMNLLSITSSDTIDTAIKEVIATAEDAILSALAEQSFIDAQKNLMDDILSDAKDQILGINPDLPEYQPPNIDMPESSGGETPGGEMPEGQQPEGERPDGEMPEGEMPGNGEGNSEEESRMIEGIYDPISGNVSYGEVFAVYYAEYLKALEAGEVPEELQEIINEYFSTLDQ